MITPADSPSNPSGYAGVAVQGTDIQAPQGDLSAVTAAAQASAMARQPQTAAVMDSAPGYGEFNITSGYSGGGGEDWPGDVSL